MNKSLRMRIEKRIEQAQKSNYIGLIEDLVASYTSLYLVTKFMCMTATRKLPILKALARRLKKNEKA